MEIKGSNKYLKIFIFIMIIFLNINVFASDTNATNYISSSYVSNQSDSNKKYYGTEIYNTGTRNLYSIGTRYNGRLSIIEYYLSWPFTAGYSSTITMNMATEDWRNNFMGVQTFCAYSSTQIGTTNWSTGSVNFISQKKIKFTINPRENCSIVKIRLYSTNVGSTAFTGVSNWNLSSIYVNDSFYSNSSGGGGSSSTPTPTPTSDYSSIINNQNQNTQSIINNQNQNTSDIIENNNQNSQNIIDSQQQLLGNCYKNIFTKELTNTWSNSRYGYNADYLEEGKQYTIYVSQNTYVKIGSQPWSVSDFQQTFNGYYSFTFHRQSDNVGLPTYILFGNPNGGAGDINLSSSSLNVMITEGSEHHSYISPNDTTCNSKLDDTNQALSDINNSINNHNVDSGTGSDFFNDFSTNDNGGISSIITKPLLIVNNLLSNNNQCSNLSLPTFMGVSNAYLPSGCILWNSAPAPVITIWNIFVCGFASYFILKDLFKIIENLKNPDNDKVEVMDL